MSQNQSLNAGRIQPDDGFQEYTVVWRIDVSAQSPREAAEFAQRIQRDPESTATSFEVSRDAFGASVTLIDGQIIDLSEEPD